MISIQDETFNEINKRLAGFMRRAPRVKTERWQGRDVRNDPAAVSYELRNVNVEVDLKGKEDLRHWAADISPNLPWADDHFLERVGGQPLNPGEQWAKWPWGKSADRFRDGEESRIFNHTYMERLWPKWARLSPGGELTGIAKRPFDVRRYPVELENPTPHQGHAHEYGDLQDLVEMLAEEPHTRQAFIPLFFPEDTGKGDGGRKVCTLGYQFLVRDDRIHIWYPLRSCDLVRHFRDDCYLAMRLMLWVLDQCRLRDKTEFWKSVKPGTYSMHMTSLHIFENDRREFL